MSSNEKSTFRVINQSDTDDYVVVVSDNALYEKSAVYSSAEHYARGYSVGVGGKPAANLFKRQSGEINAGKIYGDWKSSKAENLQYEAAYVPKPGDLLLKHKQSCEFLVPETKFITAIKLNAITDIQTVMFRDFQTKNWFFYINEHEPWGFGSKINYNKKIVLYNWQHHQYLSRYVRDKRAVDDIGARLSPSPDAAYKLHLENMNELTRKELSEQVQDSDIVKIVLKEQLIGQQCISNLYITSLNKGFFAAPFEDLKYKSQWRIYRTSAAQKAANDNFLREGDIICIESICSENRYLQPDPTGQNIWCMPVKDLNTLGSHCWVIMNALESQD